MSNDQELLIDYRSIAAPNHTPPPIKIFSFALFSGAKRELLSSVLVHFDSPTRLLIRIKVSVLHHGTTFEYFLDTLVHRRPLLNAKIAASDIECNVRAMTDGRNIARAMPSRFHLECL